MMGSVEHGSDTEIRKGWKRYEKSLPEVGKLLGAIDDFFSSYINGDIRASDLIIDYSLRFTEEHARWEIVRQELAKSLVGTLPDLQYTGAEKWAAGLNGGQIIAFEIKAMDSVLEDFTGHYKYDGKRKRGLEAVIVGREFTNTQALRDTEQVFLAVKQLMQRLFHETATPLEQQKHQTFRDRLFSLASNVPFAYQFNPNQLSLTQCYELPIVEIQSSYMIGDNLNNKDRERYTMLASLGIIGMPLLRSVAALNATYLALKPRTDGYNFAFKGSKLLERMKQDLALRLLTEIGSFETGN